MRVPLAILGSTLLLIAGCAQTPADVERAAVRAQTAQEGLDKELAGLVPGKPTSCIDQFRSRQVKAYGSTILYRVASNLVYRSDTAGGCEGIARGDVLVTRTTSTQLCSGDIAQTVDSASRFPTGSCGFGPFVAYRKP